MQSEISSRATAETATAYGGSKPLIYRNTDLLAHWSAQGAIDSGQLRAGRWFERVYSDAAFAGHAAIDLTRPKVGGRPTPAGDRSLLARMELESVRSVIGQIDFSLICRVLGQGRDLGEGTDAAQRRYLARRLRDALGELAASAGLAR